MNVKDDKITVRVPCGFDGKTYMDTCPIQTCAQYLATQPFVP
jgi:hypothetical protein